MVKITQWKTVFSRWRLPAFLEVVMSTLISQGTAELGRRHQKNTEAPHFPQSLSRCHFPLSQCWKVLFSEWSSKTELLTSTSIQERLLPILHLKSSDSHSAFFFFSFFNSYISRRREHLRNFKNNNTDVNVGTEISEMKRKIELVQKSWLQLVQALDALWRKLYAVLSLL